MSAEVASVISPVVSWGFLAIINILNSITPLFILVRQINDDHDDDDDDDDNDDDECFKPKS